MFRNIETLARAQVSSSNGSSGRLPSSDDAPTSPLKPSESLPASPEEADVALALVSMFVAGGGDGAVASQTKKRAT